MKIFIICLVMGLALNASSAALEAVDCKKEMIAAALADRINISPLSFLISSTYEVTNFDHLDNNKSQSFDYVITTKVTSAADDTTVTTDYIAKVISVKKCKVKVQLYTD